MAGSWLAGVKHGYRLVVSWHAVIAVVKIQPPDFLPRFQLSELFVLIIHCLSW